jgi:hypothetical protein
MPSVTICSFFGRLFWMTADFHPFYAIAYSSFGSFIFPIGVYLCSNIFLKICIPSYVSVSSKASQMSVLRVASSSGGWLPEEELDDAVFIGTCRRASAGVDIFVLCSGGALR